MVVKSDNITNDRGKSVSAIIFVPDVMIMLSSLISWRGISGSMYCRAMLLKERNESKDMT